MTHNRARRAVDALAIGHCAQAAVLLARPDAVGGAISGNQQSPPSWVVRLLGFRVLVQGCAEALRPSRRILLLGVGVDVTHALSMLATAQQLPAYRRAALTSAAGAAASAVAGGVTAGSW